MGTAKWLDKVDRLLPVIALSLALFLQGLVASGAAASMTVPGLVAPDGSTLTLADICNNVNDGQTGHCHACVHAPLAVLSTTLTVQSFPQLPACGNQTTYFTPMVPRPEAHSFCRTGPPTT